MIRLKNEDEINGIRKSCHLLADMFKAVIPQVKAGMSTKELDDLCKKYRLLTQYSSYLRKLIPVFPGLSFNILLEAIW